MTDYTAQEADLNSFNPVHSFTCYGVHVAGSKTMILYEKKGAASAAMTNRFPLRMSVLYECKNGNWTEIARTPVPACSFCGETEEIAKSGNYGLYKHFLVKATPMYRSALVCSNCSHRRHDEEAVSNIKHMKGL